MKRRILGILAAILVIGGTAAICGATYAGYVSSKKEIAILGTSDQRGTSIFLSPGKWELDGAVFRIYAWDATGEASPIWLENVAKSTDKGFYVFELDTKVYTKIIFARMNPAASSLSDFVNNAWWNKTGDLTYNSQKTLYQITDWGGDDGICPGTWETYSDN